MTQDSELKINMNRNIKYLLLLVVVVTIGAGYLLVKSNPENKSTLPPVSERTNPEPDSKNKLYVTKVTTGSSITVDEVGMENDGYVVVYKDNGATIGAEIGRSLLLKKGTHSGITLSLTVAQKDGDVVRIRLVDKSAVSVKDDNGNIIEVQMNVGMAHGHYDMSEY